MRLLNTSTLKPQEFEYGNIPQYAILSHRWGKEEITLQDLEQGVTDNAGFKKVQQCCERAKLDGFDYAWVDTCCINKTSSAELSEAINSMYLWYFQADKCYAYLSDISETHDIGESQWFTRGWTLQELLAPSEVYFVDAQWNDLGTRTELQEILSKRTGIPVNILSGKDDLESASIAMRMSWAAERKTQRLEDRAYCLMGIFGINMPLLYGEGERAFIRLQQEIMRVSDDQSLFAWRSLDSRGGLLATSPAAFLDSRNIVPFNHFNDSGDPSTVSSRGIHLALRFIGIGFGGHGLALLQCRRQDANEWPVAIYLKDQSWTMETFERVRTNDWEVVNMKDFRPIQYPMRRLCIRTGRMTPIRRHDSIVGEGDSITQPLIYNYEALDDLMNFAYARGLSHLAAAGSQDQVWLLLTRSDIDIVFRDDDFRTALDVAVDSGHESIVKMLLARGARVDLRTGASHRLLMTAIGNGQKGIAKLLLDYGAGHAVHKMTPLMYALERGYDSSFIELLLDRGGDVNATNDSSETPLSVASRQGDAEAVKLLLDHDSAIEAKTETGLTPLSQAVLWARHDVVNILLDHGADIETEQAPLALAATKGYTRLVELLLQRGADIERRDPDGRTPLALAALFGHSTVAEILLSKGAEIDSRDVDGRTPLTLAAMGGKESVVEVLLSQGADLDVKDSRRRTPLMLAAKGKHDSVVELLAAAQRRTRRADNSTHATR
ncbi:ankyrin repeat-containing domain protein [Trichoderma gracile]